MHKKLALFILGATCVSAFSACNDDSISDAEYTYSSTMVSAFSLVDNDDILNNLDSVFFSIDLVNAQIYNADSLPYGTDVSKLLVSISTDACSVVELTVPAADGSTSTVNYLTNSTDSINFTNGPVKLHLVSYDSKAQRDYMIHVNVHQVVPDSLYWNKLAYRALPTSLSSPTQQKTVKLDDTAVCLTTDGQSYCIAYSTDPAADNWETKSITPTFTPNISSLTATDDALYILADNGELYNSADKGLTWQTTGQTWSHIYGAHQSRLLGVENVNGSYTTVTYPATMSTAVANGFPVSNTGSTISISNKWANEPQTLMIGGKTADGSLTNTVWGYDGNSWACISKSFPTKISDASSFAYYVTETDTTNWNTTKLPVLIVMLGKNAQLAQSSVYVSRDNGINWNLGDEMLQLPTYIPAMYDAQPLIFNTTYTDSRSASAWREYQPLAVPRWWSIDYGMPQSRATEPITSWETPYIYLFGGYDGFGYLCPTVWKGVINRLTFKPLQ